MGCKVHIPTPYIKVGVPSGSIDHKGVSNENKALLLEYGAPERGIPARAFMMRTLYRINNNIATSIITNPKEGSELVLKEMIETMESEEYSPLAENTIKNRQRRGNFSIQPTVDTGDLKESLVSSFGVKNG